MDIVEKDLQDPSTGADGATGDVDLSPQAHRWLARLEDFESWISTDDPELHAEFLFDIVTVLRGMDVFPSCTDLLVSWVFFDRAEPATARSCFLPASEAASSAGRHPWISGYFAYDGYACIGIGEVSDIDGEARPVMRQSEPLLASRVFELMAVCARQCHARLGRPAPADCRDGASLRAGLVRHLRRAPPLAELVASRGLLGPEFRNPPLSEQTREGNSRALQVRLLPRCCSALDYRVPVDVMRVLAADKDLRVWTMNPGRRDEVARCLRISPSALRLAFTRSWAHPLTVLGAQCLHPETIRGVSTAAPLRRTDQGTHTVRRLEELFNRHEDIADALSRGLVRPGCVRQTRWWTPSGVQG